MNFGALRVSTLPGLLVERARTRPARVAYRAKELGIWRETTWRELAARVGALACGFAREYGIARGERVAIIGNPCPEWTVADLATQALGAITYGIYPTSAPGEVRHLLQHGGASLIVAEDQEHLDKTLEVLDECPNVRAPRSRAADVKCWPPSLTRSVASRGRCRRMPRRRSSTRRGPRGTRRARSIGTARTWPRARTSSS